MVEKAIHVDIGGAEFTTTPRCSIYVNSPILAGMRPAPPALTLEQLPRDSPWRWVVCEYCLHRRPVAFIPLIIRWKPDASSNLLRRSAGAPNAETVRNRAASLSGAAWTFHAFRSIGAKVCRP